MSSSEFARRIQDEFLPTFCKHPDRNYDPAGFKCDFKNVHPLDASNFLKAIDEGLVELKDKLYFAPRTYGGEQLFNEGEETKSPRPVYLSLEVVISIATTIRLRDEYGWPPHLIGTQPKGGAFDVTAFLRNEDMNEYVACEVKKTKSGTDKLLTLMTKFNAEPALRPANDTENNAFKKVCALRERHPPVFWALGPGDYGHIFQVTYADDERVNFEPTSAEALRYPIIQE